MAPKIRRMSTRTVLIAGFVALALCGRTTGAQEPPVPADRPLVPGAFHIELGPREPVFGLIPMSVRRGLPDEHTSFLKYPDGTFRMWSGTAAGGLAVVLKAGPALGRFIRPASGKILGPPGPGSEESFDHDYAAPGQVVQDPADPTKLYMLYEAEWLCFGSPPSCPPRSERPSTWVSVGIAQADDPGADGYPRKWTGFLKDPKTNRFGRTIALGSPDPKPPADPGTHGYYGLGIPSGMVDPRTGYLYAFYTYHALPGTIDADHDHRVEVARVSFATLHSGVPVWLKWDAPESRFDIPWDGRSYPILTQATTVPACANENHPSVSYNVALGRYLMVVICNAEWYYSTATSMEAQDWTTPQLLAPIVPGCKHACADWYPSPVSLDRPSSSTTSQNGFIYFLRANHYWRRSFTIVADGI